MWTLYEPENRAKDAKTLADFFGRKFFGGKQKPVVPTTSKAMFFMVEDYSDTEENTLEQAA